jgi:DNA-binding NtrC family response regulator
VTFTPGALRALFRYDWPLNIRELDNVLQRAVALTPDGVIDLAHLELHQSMAPPVRSSAPPASDPPARAGDRDALPPSAVGTGDAPRAPASQPALSAEDGALRERLVDLLTEHRGNVVIVARTLGRRRMQVYRWARRFGLDLESFRR